MDSGINQVDVHVGRKRLSNPRRHSLIAKVLSSVDIAGDADGGHLWAW